jgi:transporter family protein
MMQPKNKSLACSLTAMAAWGVWAFLPKVALQTLPPYGILFYEAIGGMLAVVPVLFFMKGKLQKTGKGISLTAYASGVGVLAILAYYDALQQGPVATIVTMTSMYPVVTLALARIFLKEKINGVQLAAAGMALAAIALLAG